MDLFLYRIKVFGPRLPGLFDGPFIPSNVLSQAIVEQPTTRRYRGVQWHIGNVEKIDGSGFYFRLGRTSRALVSQIDSHTGDFVEENFESAPYTHVVLDSDLELVALARKTTLAPTPDAIAGRLLRVLAASEVSGDLSATFSIGQISNPDTFLDTLKAAYAIRAFTFSVQRKNPFDVNKLFVEPFERYVEAAGAVSGTVTVKGTALTETPLEEVARSAAATGDEASARVQLEHRHKPVTRRLRGDAAMISSEGLDTPETRMRALNDARAQHRRIRRDDGAA